MQNIKALCHMKESTLLMIGGEVYLAGSYCHFTVVLVYRSVGQCISELYWHVS